LKPRADFLAQVVDHGFHALQVNAGHQQHELLATETEKLVSLTGTVIHQFGEVNQDVVPETVPMLVVDPFEVIQIQDHQGVGGAHALGR